MFENEQMGTHQITYQFPNALRDARLKAGVQQKDVANRIGVDAPLICALERGRRIGPAEPLVSELCRALQLTEAVTEVLIKAARRDRAVKWFTVNASPRAADFIGACLSAVDELTVPELACLQHQVENLVVCKRRLRGFVLAIPCGNDLPEGVSTL